MPLMRAGHEEADFLARQIARGKAWRKLAARDDGDAVCHFENFIEVLADDENGSTLARQINQRLPDKGGGTSIHTPCRLIDDEQGWRAVESI